MRGVLARTTRADANSNIVNHMAVEMGTRDESASQFPPRLSESMCDFSDGSYDLYTLYSKKIAEFDRELLNNWTEHMRDLIVLSGLLSAAIAAFLAPVYLASLPSSSDVSAFYLARIYQLQANLSDSNRPSQEIDISSIPLSDSTQGLWFFGLGTSLSSAVLAMLLQSWVRRYMVMTQPQRSPRSRALIQAYVRLEGFLDPLQLTLDVLHLLLDFAIFAFLFGLTILLAGPGSLFPVLFIAYLLFMFYVVLSIRSLRRHTIYSTPFSKVTRHIKPLVKLISPTLMSTVSFKPPPDRRSNAFLAFNWVTLDSIDQVVENLNVTHPSSLDKEIVAWLFRSLHHDQDLEHFLETIPGFYDSDLVKQPEQVFRPFHEDQVPRAILSSMRRTLSSTTLPSEIKQRRIRLILKVMALDPYLLERTFFHTHTLSAKPTIFQCVDFVLLADGFSREANGNLDTQFLAKCIIAVAISHLTAQDLMDGRWSHVLKRWLPFPISAFDTISEGHLSSIKLDNLVSLVEVLLSADTKYGDELPPATLSAACNFPVKNVASESRSKFCDLWNQLVRDSAPAVSASLILPNIRTIYNTLHGGINDSPIDQALPSSSYPSCTDSTHRPMTHQDIAPVLNVVIAN